jgi:hypothetical protein
MSKVEIHSLFLYLLAIIWFLRWWDCCWSDENRSHTAIASFLSFNQSEDEVLASRIRPPKGCLIGLRLAIPVVRLITQQVVSQQDEKLLLNQIYSKCDFVYSPSRRKFRRIIYSKKIRTQIETRCPQVRGFLLGLRIQFKSFYTF